MTDYNEFTFYKPEDVVVVRATVDGPVLAYGVREPLPDGVERCTRDGVERDRCCEPPEQDEDIALCTRLDPHRCRLNGPCNGLPRGGRIDD